MRQSFHLRLFISIVVITIALCIASASAQRAGWHLVKGHWLKASGECEFSDLISFNFNADEFIYRFTPSKRAAQMLTGHRHAGIEIGPAGDLYDVVKLEIPPGLNLAARQVLEIRALLERDHDGVDGAFDPNPDRDVMISSSLRPVLVLAKRGALRIECRGQRRGNSVFISLMIDGESAILRARTRNETAGVIDEVFCQSKSLSKMLDEHPVDSRRYLSLMFRSLAAPAASVLFTGPSDVYRGFPDIPPDPHITQHVLEILPRMLDADYSKRDAALDELRSLGAAGVCAAAHLKTDSLAPQQRAFVDQILYENARGKYHRMSTEQLRRDPVFLSDCLEFPDAKVRAAAIEASPNLKVDPRDPAACAEAADRVRDKLRRPPGGTVPER